MGSYLSIVNNTNDVWVCKVSPDEVALKVGGIAISTVDSIKGVIGSSSVATVVSGGVSVSGVSASALSRNSNGASSFTLAVANGITGKLKSMGYQEIQPGNEHRYGKFSLSLWQQGTCVNTYIVNERTVRSETVYLRPIFSGATDKSTLKHEIQFWINKHNTEKTDVTAKSTMKHVVVKIVKERSVDTADPVEAKGAKGDNGAKDDNGGKGDKGDKGDSRAKGDKGNSGAKGDKGNNGAKGDKAGKNVKVSLTDSLDSAGSDSFDSTDSFDSADSDDSADSTDSADSIDSTDNKKYAPVHPRSMLRK